MSLRGQAVALVAAASLLAAACAGERARSTADDFCARALARVDSFFATAPAALTDPQHGGTAVTASYGEIADGMNGLVSADYTASQFQSFVNLMTLIEYDAELRPAPYLARAWEVSDDERELTFYLRDDVYWHDGTQSTAYDVEFTYLRATDPATAFPNASYWTHYVKGREGVEVLDSFTVKLRMQPHAEFLDPWRATAIMPRHLLEDVPPAELKQHPFGTRCPVGNGPFRFIEHRQDEAWTFGANPFFPAGLGGRPYLDRLLYRIILEQTTLLTELLTGNIDLYVGVGPSQGKEVQASQAAELRHFPFRQYVFVVWNARRPQFADPRVRRALTMAVNRQTIVDAILQGYGRIANAGVPPFHWAYDPSFAGGLPYDPKGAAKLLEEAGWIDRDGDGVRENADGVPFRFTLKSNKGNQARADIAEVVQANLAELGIVVEPQIVEWATLLNQLNTPELRDFDGVVMAWVVDFNLDERDLFHSQSAEQPYGWVGLEDPRVDRLLDTLPLVANREEAIPLWRDYQTLIVELQPYMYLYFSERLDGVSRRLRDAVMDVRGDWVNARQWWIPPEERRERGRAAAR
ncbi:MAG: hypothetical protein HY704_09870 [Gemmatimonadetes bacterium]|nr:hypothetical protein [Gemmatimonadota bacterium]